MTEDSRIVIENIQPSVEDGNHPVKRVLDESVTVTADIYTNGVEHLQATVLFKHESDKKWKSVKMAREENDSWAASFNLSAIGTYFFKIEAWIDKYSLWIENLRKWRDSGEDISKDIKEGVVLIRNYCLPDTEASRKKLDEILSGIKGIEGDKAISFLSSRKVRNFMFKFWKREYFTKSGKEYTVVVDKQFASFSSWYELFPRSQSSKKGKTGTFKDVEKRIPDIRELGFDVLYLTPIHPIGKTNRRGRNGARKAGKNDPGSPWAIGNEYGGHKSINPDLGTINDFMHLVNFARSEGLEIALDIAFQCSPDHPYVKDHPDWFYRMHDGTIRYAENPPKKYYDIYPLNFDTPDWKNMWEEMKSIFLFWIGKGVRIFRVDNPHTKPFSFWKWVISEIKKINNDVIFLSEAFTRPKVMYELSKLGFSQSYSYFTWRNYHYELIDYFREINSRPTAEHFRPVLFTNTPDILTENLQINGRPAFMYRAFLASTLSPSWGIYSGYELCENRAIPGTEEYMNSEKYEIKQRNWKAKGTIRGFIRKLNEVRMQLEPMKHYRNLTFLGSDNPNVLAYERKYGGESVYFAVNINPSVDHSATISLPADAPEISSDGINVFREHMTGNKLTFYGRNILVNLKPGIIPGIILTRS